MATMDALRRIAGRDGRSRPVDAAAQRKVIWEAVARHPDMTAEPAR